MGEHEGRAQLLKPWSRDPRLLLLLAQSNSKLKRDELSLAKTT